MLAGGGIGKSAVRGREGDWVGKGSLMDDTACCITAGVGGVGRGSCVCLRWGDQ